MHKSNIFSIAIIILRLYLNLAEKDISAKLEIRSD